MWAYFFLQVKSNMLQICLHGYQLSNFKPTSLSSSTIWFLLGIVPHAPINSILGLVQVVLAANDLPSINDVTYIELVEIVKKVMVILDM